MPISSGATGRVDAGVDTSITWTPDGGRKEGKPPSWSGDSYLQRYLETHGKVKHDGNTAGDSAQQQDGQEGSTGETETQQKHAVGNADASGQPAREEDGPKKSRTCTLL